MPQLAYLGRINVALDDGRSPPTVAIADHWMKWAFHFLVDASPSSPTYGLPLRLYGTLGVRQVDSLARTLARIRPIDVHACARSLSDAPPSPAQQNKIRPSSLPDPVPRPHHHIPIYTL